MFMKSSFQLTVIPKWVIKCVVVVVVIVVVVVVGRHATLFPGRSVA